MPKKKAARDFSKMGKKGMNSRWQDYRLTTLGKLNKIYQYRNVFLKEFLKWPTPVLVELLKFQESIKK